jgi:digeranylgeranylglycerophospholipid reductase
MLEEHRVIGLPRHCAGRLQGSSFTSDIVSELDKRVILSECRSRRFYSPSGKLVLETPIPSKSSYMLVRDEFDRELGRLAARAGAEIVLNTKVTGLMKKSGKVCGVETNSNDLPGVHGRVVICAAGGASRVIGIPAWEGMSDVTEEFSGGALIELQNVHGLKSGVPEVHLGELTPTGFARIWTRDNKSAWVTCPSLDAFNRMRRGKSLYAEKMREAVMVQLHGWTFGTRAGDQLPELVKDGLMLVGDSAGYTSMIHAVVSGRFAAETAVDAISEGNTKASRLAEYQKRCEKLGLHRTGLSWKTLNQLGGLTDKQIEERIPRMIKKGEMVYLDILPF